MRCEKLGWAVAILVLVMVGSAQADVRTMTATTTVVGNDNWNQPANWDTAVPSATDSAVIDAGLAARCNAAAPTYSGGLTISDGSSLRIDNIAGAENAIGTGP